MSRRTRAIQGETFDPSVNLTLVAFAFIIPVLVQVGLLLALVPLYPWHALSRLRRVAIYGATLALIAARTAVVTFCIHAVVTQTPQSDVLSVAPWQGAWDTTYPKIAWTLQLGSDLYASFLFLLRARQGSAFDDLSPQCQTQYDAQYSSTPSRRTSALTSVSSSFVAPVVFGLVQLVLVMLEDPRKGRYSALYIILANVYVEIISLLFVGLWHPSVAAPLPPPDSSTAPEYVEQTNVVRFLSPLPVHPRIQLYEASCRSSIDGSMRDSATVHMDHEWKIDPSVEKLQIVEAMAAYPAHGQSNGAMEPSLISFSGSIQTDGHGEPVFYAV
ncbi:hypothetical protein OH77DRAFT_1524256 [Trametes cingulata]|nr:hypothetical protein OH77DRAFT_1524256 [Trametes cingulata]